MLYNFKIIINILELIDVSKLKIFLLFSILFSLIACELISLSIVIPFVSSILNLNQDLDFLSFLNLDNISKDKIIFSLLFLLIFFLILKTIIALFARWYICTFSFAQFARIQRQLLFNYHSMDLEEFNRRNTSDYIASIRELSAHTVSNIEANFKIAAEIIVASFIFSYLFYLNYKILLYVLFLITPVVLIYSIFLKPINKKLGNKRNIAIKNIFKEVVSSIEGIKELRVLNKVNFFLTSLYKNAMIVKEVQQKTTIINESPRYIFELFLITFAIISIYILSLSTDDITNFLPIITVFLFAGIKLLPSISFIVSNLNRAAELLPSTEKIFNDLKKFSKEKYSKSLINRNNTKQEIESIEIKNLSFYFKNTRNSIFENLNFSIKKKQCIGIIGKSGEGKTTFVDILLGLIKPTSGEIIINNDHKIKKNLIEMGNVAYLPQNPVILDESIKTNVSLDRDSGKLEEDKIYDSLEAINLKSFINNLPDKIDTLIGENGVRLSIGQNKRLALARTIYHNKNFIIMDEATSSQDQVNQDLISELIKELKGTHTIIIISHQMDALKYCDQIYKIENKKIILDKNNIL